MGEGRSSAPQGAFRPWQSSHISPPAQGTDPVLSRLQLQLRPCCRGRPGPGGREERTAGGGEFGGVVQAELVGFEVQRAWAERGLGVWHWEVPVETGPGGPGVARLEWGEGRAGRPSLGGIVLLGTLTATRRG